MAAAEETDCSTLDATANRGPPIERSQFGSNNAATSRHETSTAKRERLACGGIPLEGGVDPRVVGDVRGRWPVGFGSPALLRVRW